MSNHPRRADQPEERGPQMPIMGDAAAVGVQLLPGLAAAIAATALLPGVVGFLGPLGVAARAAAIVWFAVGLLFWGSAGVNLVRAFRADRLCTRGAYGLSRHPIFAWWTCFVLPSAGFFFDSWALLVVAAWVAWKVRPSMHAEDAYLAERFGAEHARYVERVPALFPVPRPRSVAGTLAWVAGAAVLLAAWWGVLAVVSG